MKKEVVEKLNQKARIVASRFSHFDREHNHNNETFKVNRIIVLSEFTAAVTYLKNTGKKVLAFFYYVNMNGGEWFYFFPTDSHILGMAEFGKFKQAIEDFNFELAQPTNEEGRQTKL